MMASDVPKNKKVDLQSNTITWLCDTLLTILIKIKLADNTTLLPNYICVKIDFMMMEGKVKQFVIVII